MFGKVNSAAISGIDGVLISVEADVSNGLPCFDMVGYLSSAVKEARERVRTALKNAGFRMPPARITVSLAPADLRKQGNGYDLPIAIAILVASGHIPQKAVEDIILMGELSLNGTVCPINGVLSLVAGGVAHGFTSCFVPADNAKEAAFVAGIQVYGVHSLEEAVDILLGEKAAEPVRCIDEERYEYPAADFREINGQIFARRATEVAAAGFHNILYVGPPGAGKTMLAKRIPGILPPLTRDEQIQISKIYSIRGMLLPTQPLLKNRPFRNPHHTIPVHALIGGGGFPKPGEISLASNGVLFLDELTEFKRETLETLRQPLEEKQVVLSRIHGSYVFPADFMFCAAINPCPCGYYPDRQRCICTPSAIKRYLGRISKPLLDRIDISVEVQPSGYEEIAKTRCNEPSETIRERVMRAMQTQLQRYQHESILFNSQLTGDKIKQYCILGEREQYLMKKAFQQMNLSGRAYERIIKVARTIADLEGSEKIGTPHLAEAIGYRSSHTKYWGD